MRPDRERAEEILRKEFHHADEASIDPIWADRFEKIGNLVGNNARTIIAVLGTQLLAKATAPNANVYALQAKASAPGAFSARGLCTQVMAPVSLELGVDLGVRSPEPHNNQPFFGRPMIDESITNDVRNTAAYEYLLEILSKIDVIEKSDKHRQILRTFLHVRSETKHTGLSRISDVQATVTEFTTAATRFVAERSENGRRAQALAVGLLDVLATSEHVKVGRINDPDRRFPGDVAVRDLSEAEDDVRVWEVRDKPVSVDDARFSADKCAGADAVTKLAILAVSQEQEPFETDSIIEWAEDRGVILRIYFGWQQFIDECFFWSALPASGVVDESHESIHRRLKDAEVSSEALRRWSQIFEASNTG